MDGVEPRLLRQHHAAQLAPRAAAAQRLRDHHLLAAAGLGRLAGAPGRRGGRGGGLAGLLRMAGRGEAVPAAHRRAASRRPAVQCASVYHARARRCWAHCGRANGRCWVRSLDAGARLGREGGCEVVHVWRGREGERGRGWRAETRYRARLGPLQRTSTHASGLIACPACAFAVSVLHRKAGSPRPQRRDAALGAPARSQIACRCAPDRPRRRGGLRAALVCSCAVPRACAVRVQPITMLHALLLSLLLLLPEPR